MAWPYNANVLRQSEKLPRLLAVGRHKKAKRILVLTSPRRFSIKILK